MNLRIYRTQALFCLLALLSISSLELRGQEGKRQQAKGDDGILTGQLVDSRKGYVTRIPVEARIDSSSSGWSPKGRYEIRVYRMPGAGIIQLTATVKQMEIPANAISNGTYTYTESDSATERGTAKIRTYYLPTRSVRIELIPTSIRMLRYLEGSDAIFSSFRWKPGANTDAVNTDP